MSANKAASSLMFMQYLDSITEFCDDAATAPRHLKHNYLAPNRQNRLCNYKSAWEVMREHPDFAKPKKPLGDDTDTRPVFRYVQAHPRKRVLVLDTSGSMTGASLNVLKQAASNYILSCIETGSKLGIVQFNTNASALSQLKEVGSDRDRFALIDALPTQADGKTSIGSGLKKGVEVLTKSGDAPGGSIILITDGKENEEPYLKDLRPALMKRGIVVHALAYGQRAEQSIAELSQETGGKTFFYSGRPDSTALIDGLAATVATETSAIPKANIPLSLLTEAGMVTKSKPMRGTFYLDTTVGKETSLTIGYSQKIQVRLQGPTAYYHSDTHPEHFRYNEATRVLKVMVPGEAEAGMWSYLISTQKPKAQVSVNIQSKPRKEGVDVIQVSSWIPEQGEVAFSAKQKFGIYAEVLRGKAPVLNARVVATIERPQSSPIDVELFDNGVGTDIIKDDGVYAASIMAKDLMGNGRYNAKVKVLGSEGQTKVVVRGGRAFSGALEMEGSSHPQGHTTAGVENFQRVTSAGEFRLRGFQSSSAEELPDEMAPSKITDLRVTSFDFETFTATLQWTAVGGDMERGNASHYIILTSEDFDQLMFDRANAAKITEELLLRGTLKQPLPSGTLEEMDIKLHDISDNKTVFLTVIAVDDSGNEGDASNIVSLSPAKETAVPRVPLDHGISLQTYLAIAVPVSVVLFLAAVVVIGLLVSRSKKMKSENIEQVQHIGHLSNSMHSLDLSNMNYMFDGEYRKRLQEDPDTWSKGSI